MARGGRRPGSGRPRKPVELHVLHNTFRPARHGERPATALLPMPVSPSDWHPTPEDREGLREMALLWLDTTISMFRLDPVEGLGLLAAVRTLNRIDEMEQAIKADGVTVAGKPHRLLPALSREQRIFQSQWVALRLERP